MTKALTKNEKKTAPDTEDVKLRQCLRCQSDFESAWAGERICGRCKGSNAWRSSVPLDTRPVGGSH